MKLNPKILLYKGWLFLIIFILLMPLLSNTMDRPFIWVNSSDRQHILDKIENNSWAAEYFSKYKNRVDNSIIEHQSDVHSFFSDLPFSRSQNPLNGHPTLKVYPTMKGEDHRESRKLQRYLQIALDCGVIYYLTEEKKYAQCALDILHTFIEGIIEITPSNELGNGGWLYLNDHLREAREIGAQVPIIYDFIHSFIIADANAYDLGKQKKVKFDLEKAQQVFRTYSKLAISHGHTGSNWSVLESPSLVYNALALENSDEREKTIQYYLSESTDRQEALPEIGAPYKKYGDVYPETSQYSNGVAYYTTTLLVSLTRLYPNLFLGKKYEKIPFSLDRWDALRYPNGELISLGDGKRTFSSNYIAYEMALILGDRNKLLLLTNKFSGLLNSALKTGQYERGKLRERSSGASVYLDPLTLLWFEELPEGIVEYELNRTETLPHAGVFLQRNPSPTGKIEDDMMGFVGGGHYVHGHASGMNIELYGEGQVLGVDGGRNSYRTDIHENYYRLYAAHNTIIVNGSSASEGGWVNLGINQVEKEIMEPEPAHQAVSPNYSFSRTTFLDDKGELAEAKQERNLLLIRTSDTSGYYVDLFRSKSSLPNEYHDYLYHNIGDKIVFLNDDLNWQEDPGRFQANANNPWKNNKKFRHPGWHFFKDVYSSNAYSEDVNARFNIEKLAGENIFMNVVIPGNDNRDFTHVKAPSTFQAPEVYKNLATPTLVIRQNGEAWKNPFIVLYESYDKHPDNNTVIKVDLIEENGSTKGLKVTSQLADKMIVQYIIIQPKDETFVNKKLGMEFQGACAIYTIDENQKLIDMYMGDGTLMSYKGYTFQSENNKRASVYFDNQKKSTQINTTAKIIFSKKGDSPIEVIPNIQNYGNDDK